MDEQLQQEIIKLVQAAMNNDEQAIQQIQQIMQAAEQGDPQAAQIAQLIQQIIQEQQGGVPKDKFGAKIEYIKRLKGICPEGQEMQFFKKGGRVCKKCMPKVAKKGCKVKKGAEGTPMPEGEGLLSKALRNLASIRAREESLRNPAPYKEDTLEEVTKTSRQLPNRRGNYVTSYVDESGNFMNNDSTVNIDGYQITKYPDETLRYYNKKQGAEMNIDPANPQYQDFLNLFNQGWEKNDKNIFIRNNRPVLVPIEGDGGRVSNEKNTKSSNKVRLIGSDEEYTDWGRIRDFKFSDGTTTVVSEEVDPETGKKIISVTGRRGARYNNLTRQGQHKVDSVLNQIKNPLNLK